MPEPPATPDAPAEAPTPRPIEVRSWHTGQLLIMVEAESLKSALELKVSEGAALRDADLTRADLRRADLRRADLRDSDLRRADLRRADLRRADLRPIQADFLDILVSAPGEVVGLRAALVEGRVDGSVYEGEYACLFGTIAKVRGVAHDALGDLRPDGARPAERFFLAIKPGDTPDTNAVSLLAVEWIDRFLAAAATATARGEGSPC